MIRSDDCPIDSIQFGWMHRSVFTDSVTLNTRFDEQTVTDRLIWKEKQLYWMQSPRPTFVFQMVQILAFYQLDQF